MSLRSFRIWSIVLPLLAIAALVAIAAVSVLFAPQLSAVPDLWWAMTLVVAGNLFGILSIALLIGAILVASVESWRAPLEVPTHASLKLSRGAAAAGFLSCSFGVTYDVLLDRNPLTVAGGLLLAAVFATLHAWMGTSRRVTSEQAKHQRELVREGIRTEREQQDEAKESKDHADES